MILGTNIMNTKWVCSGVGKVKITFCMAEVIVSADHSIKQVKVAEVGVNRYR